MPRYDTTSRFSDDEILDALVNRSQRQAARHLQVTRPALQRRLRRMDREALEPNEAALPADPTPWQVREEEAAGKIRRLEAENAELRGRAKRAERRADEAEDLRSGVFRLTQSIDDEAPWQIEQAVHGQTELLPVLFTSDLQVGEEIDPDEVDGMNAYNGEIFQQRYARMIERTVDYATHHVGYATFPGIYYLRGGDAISNSIHDELAETNDLSAVPAVRHLFRNEREGIRRLVDQFGRVRVYSIPGNHDRTTPKPRSKRYTEHSFDTLLSWWLQSAFEDDPRVEFVIPKSGDAYLDAMGWKVLLSHGDRMGSRGGMGFMGPIATIARGHQKLHMNWERTGKRVDVVLTGHLHTSVKTELGYGNGSMAGYSEYARDLRVMPDAPKQWLFFFHKRYGVSAQVELILGKRPLRTVEDR